MPAGSYFVAQPWQAFTHALEARFRDNARQWYDCATVQ